jgi:hypothetical protein
MNTTGWPCSNFLEEISRQDLSTILYVSHRRDEYRSFFKQEVSFT